MFIALATITALPGCTDSNPPPVATSSTQPAAAPSATPLANRESWDIYYVQGARSGYGRVSIEPVIRSGRQLLRVTGLNHLSVQRFGQQTEQEIRFTSIETPDGQLLEFETDVDQGAIPMRTVGRVVGDRLNLEITTRGKTISTSIPWSPDYGGFYATEQSLLRRPMQPGQRRTIRALPPGLNEVVTSELVAKDYESVRLLGATLELLRIDTAMRFSSGQTIRGTMWCDRLGETLKTRTDAMQLETVRATKALALDSRELGKVELGIDTLVKVDRRLSHPHETKRIRYRIHLEGEDPADVFVSGASQEIKPIDSNTAELTVHAIRPGGTGDGPNSRVNENGTVPFDAGSADDLPTDADRLPNNLIQSDDARIVAMARQAVGDERDPWQRVLALERYAKRRMTKVDFSSAFATAAEVAENPVGDCTEHAVLLAALIRACGIPARVAIGLVYIESAQAFGYHMWTEVYVQRRWIPLDATLAKGGIGAAHLKLTHSNLHGASPYSSFLPMVPVMGRLSIEIEEVE